MSSSRENDEVGRPTSSDDWDRILGSFLRHQQQQGSNPRHFQQSDTVNGHLSMYSRNPSYRQNSGTTAPRNDTMPPLSSQFNHTNDYLLAGGRHASSSTKGARSLNSSTNDSHYNGAVDTNSTSGSEEGVGRAVRKKTREKERRAELSTMFKELTDRLEQIPEHDLDPEVLEDEEEIRKNNNRKKCFGNSVPTNRVYIIARVIEVIERLCETNRSLKKDVRVLHRMIVTNEGGAAAKRKRKL